jgi:hypothetical protein
MSFFRRNNEKKQKGKNKSSDKGTSNTSNVSASASSTVSVDADMTNDMQSVPGEASTKKVTSVSGSSGGESNSNNSMQSKNRGSKSNSAEDSNVVPTVDSTESAHSKLMSDSNLKKAMVDGKSSTVDKDSSAVSMDLKEVDYDVNPTLLYKFIEQREWGEALERCTVAPEEAATWVVRHQWKNKNVDECIDYENDTDKIVRWRMLPIHSAIIFKAPLDLVKAVLQAYPEGIHGPDDRKMLPIHLCCRHLTNLDVAKYLITTDKESLTRTDYKGRTPLVILKEYRYKDPRKSRNKEKLTDEERTNLDVLIKMIEDLKIVQSTNNDNASREVDYDMTPTVLIKLIERKMWKQAINRCEDYPEEAATWMCRLQEVKEQGGGVKDVKWKILPIHSAIILHSPVEVIETLIDAYPQGLRKGDDRKMLPLHMAFRIGASLDVTAVLVDAYPDALKKRDIKGHTPIHILKAYERKYEKEKRQGSDKEKDTFADKNRKRLIKFYLGTRKYGDDDDETLAPYDSEGSYSDNSDDDSTIFMDDDEDEYDGLFYRNMLTDLSAMAMKGLTALPRIVRDTFTCRT